ncbi:uncharacterized protein MONOS_12580 [Monocercomonoides exilis]|uniref:uncharacterized protein n=1 Tax=Monocercomonoides exilis TaxID=2049356 RepID=UPI00355A9C3C|nr:hypothetical protein MONOS_12580 [Monocercomonoides exilis]|eukprot:MONOS_12580.1-p1 / transcript=MONOS_12580.1 / gene=MONOS_12580 / organism=Monocercomonoides_exilis_PA203 / gene_product=unspecified product / transcript_product=unspecified product / location=Mono_scaffold00705:975-2439(+) / protein_length=445 / sequence_SO=supercontig / SO=protein_coding / is_pseudo=false
MSLPDDDYSEYEPLTTSRTVQFSKLFDELDHCGEDEQTQKIREMNEIIEEMNEIVEEMDYNEFRSIFTTRMFNKIEKMIEENTMSLESAILLLKHIGYCKMLKMILSYSFDYSSLSERLKKMIIEEQKEKEEKNEKLLVDLCECYIQLNRNFSPELLSICIPCLLVVALNKEEKEESKKDVEIVLLTLCRIVICYFIEQKLYLNEIKEIIQYHQEHRNLTRLAYQSAWKFLIFRMRKDDSLEEVITKELHFAREVASELEDQMKCVDWKREKEERGKETKEEVALLRWLDTINCFFNSCRSWNEDFAGLIRRTVQILRASRENYKKIHVKCLHSIQRAAEEKIVKIDDLLKGESVDIILEEIQQPTTYNNAMMNCLYFFLEISERLKEKTDNKANEAKRMELKRKIFEKMEEKGYEDTIASLYGVISFVYLDLTNYQNILQIIL